MRAKHWFVIFCAGVAGRLLAVPPNTPILDGRPTEYDDAELRGHFIGSPQWGSGNVLSNLFVTWNEEALFIALQGWETDNKLVVMLDVDPDAGTGATTTTNWANVEPAWIKYNDVGWRASTQTGAEAFGLDYQIASEGFFNNVLRILYDGVGVPDTNTVEVLFDRGNGSTPAGTPVDMVVYSDDTSCDLKGLEARIPWNVLYGLPRFGAVQPGEIIPRGARLRLFANIHNNDPASSYSAPDTIPVQTNVAGGAQWSDGLLTTANYITLDLDQNGDGIPDMAPGDLNAPFLRVIVGKVGQSSVYARFNEAVSAATATNVENWRVGGASPVSVGMIGADRVLLNLGAPVTAGLIRVEATNVEDVLGNRKRTYLCWSPPVDGISSAALVRFVLQTASGLGLSPGASNFFLNGSAEPLEWGYPPSMNTPLTRVGTSTWFACEVLFPPGTLTQLVYKYSGVLNNTGTNTYEAIRLHNYATAARYLGLPPNGGTLVVTDYLGAAAAPWRAEVVSNAYKSLYEDPRRGDAGVRDRVEVTFQLNLSGRDLYGVSRVVVVGSDPLRGFNLSGVGVSDWPGNYAVVGWDFGGIELVDDGTRGDAVAGDGIYSRTWSFTTNGLDPLLVQEPHSLVGGDYDTVPYGGTGWLSRRSPRSFAWKYAVVFNATNALEDPPYDLEYYLPEGVTQLVLQAHVWGNANLPLKPASEPPKLKGLSPTPTSVRVFFTNALNETRHGVEFSTNLLSGWLDYGLTASGSGGSWTGEVSGLDAQLVFLRAYSGQRPFRHVWWHPNPIPTTGATLRIWYYQHGRLLAGRRDVHWYGATNPWYAGVPFVLKPMTFVGEGTWRLDLPVPAPTGANQHIQFLFTDSLPSLYDKNGGAAGGDYRALYAGRCAWTPDPVEPGGTLTIVYDSAGGPLATATQIFLHVGFDGWEGSGWRDVVSPRPALTGTPGGLWTVNLPVPTNYSRTVNFCFTTLAVGDGGQWDNNNWRDWNAFIGMGEP